MWTETLFTVQLTYTKIKLEPLTMPDVLETKSAIMLIMITNKQSGKVCFL